MSSPSGSSRRNFIKIGLGVVGGAVVASAVALPLYLNQNSQDATRIATLEGQLNAANQSATALQGQVGTLQDTLSGLTGFLFFNVAEQPLVEAIAETMIPRDQTGPGAKEARVIYFIDRQLASDYGKNAGMYMKPPFVPLNQKGPLTVAGSTYAGGSAPARIDSGAGYQYPVEISRYWRRGLKWLQDYCNSAFGANFEKLSAANQTQALKDLWNNKPTNFQGPTPKEFFSEMHDMIWAGFFTDPMYGGNRGMVGWELIGYTGTNQGNAHGEGYTVQQLMVMDHPVRLKPQSLAQFEAQQEGGK